MRPSKPLSTLLIGLMIGGAARWSASRSLSQPAAPLAKTAPREAEQVIEPDTTSRISDTPKSLPSIEEIANLPDQDFLAALVMEVSKAGPGELENLLTQLDAESRQETMTKDLIFLRWMEIDPLGGLEAGKAHGHGNSAYWAWGKIDPDAALAHAQESGNHRGAGQVVRAIGQDDPEAGIALLESGVLPAGSQSSAWDGALDNLGYQDPERALEISLEKDLWSTDVAVEWIQKEPLTAFAWIAEHVPIEEQSDVLASFDTLLKTHPSKAKQAIASVRPGWLRVQLDLAHANYLSRADSPEAAAAFDALPSHLKDYGRVSLAEDLIIRNPEEAYSILETIRWEEDRNPRAYEILSEHPDGTSPSNAKSISPVNVLRNLAERDPERAATFLEPLPPSDLTKEAYEEVVEEWMEADSMAASSWVSQLPKGTLKDEAISTMNQSLTNNSENPPDFEAATLWTLQMSDTESMQQQLHDIFSRWKSTDAQSAQAGLALPGLPNAFIESFQP